MKSIIFLKISCFIICSLVLNNSGFTQSNISIVTKTGYQFNTPIELNGEPAINLKAGMFEAGIAYELSLRKKFFTEIGIAGRIIFATGKVNQIPFNTTTTRVRTSFKFGYHVTNKWAVATGVAFQNNKDFGDIELLEKYYYRCNFVFEGKYKWREKWFFIGGFNFELRDIPDAYFINDPKTTVLIGVARKL